MAQAFLRNYKLPLHNHKEDQEENVSIVSKFSFYIKLIKTLAYKDFK